MPQVAHCDLCDSSDAYKEIYVAAPWGAELTVAGGGTVVPKSDFRLTIGTEQGQYICMSCLSGFLRAASGVVHVTPSITNLNLGLKLDHDEQEIRRRTHDVQGAKITDLGSLIRPDRPE